jgi:type II secretory pathway pseudopilin PulG
MGTLRRTDGFTLVELLLVCTISIVIFGATMTAWTSLHRQNRAVELQNDNAEDARLALDRAARQLRNLANPTVNAITTIDRATGYDFIFQTSDPSKTWVRYCVQTSGGGTSPSSGRLWESESPGAISAGMRGACPGTGWSKSAVVVDHVTNQTGGIDRDVFTFECAKGMPASCPASAAEYTRVRNVHVALWIDRVAGDRVSELNLATSVYLRNQNEAPTSSGSWSRLAKEKVLLNGSGSSDPEGRTLEYFWFETTPPTAAQLASTACTAKPAGTVWEGVTFAKTFPAGSAGTSKTFYLLVRDPGCLVALSPPIAFQVPT